MEDSNDAIELIVLATSILCLVVQSCFCFFRVKNVARGSLKKKKMESKSLERRAIEWIQAVESTAAPMMLLKLISCIESVLSKIVVKISF